jgi:hypothetical protein
MDSGHIGDTGMHTLQGRSPLGQCRLRREMAEGARAVYISVGRVEELDGG